MNSAMVVKIAIVATVTVGGMDAVVEPIGIYSRRVTGETMTIHPTHLMNSSMVIKMAIVATVTVGGMAVLSHLTHKDMGNATMMLGTSLAM
ncbi:MAG: hypothetical protein ACRCVP_07025 [Shewanella xiamenensis]